MREKPHSQRCEEQGHDWENCCSILFEIYQQCKWCKAIKQQTPYPLPDGPTNRGRLRDVEK